MESARTYRRRRVGAAVFAVIIAYALYAAARADAEQQPLYHTVASGETLWSIAASHYSPSEDPRVAMEEIRRSNSLEGYSIRPGEHLELPYI